MARYIHTLLVYCASSLGQCLIIASFHYAFAKFTILSAVITLALNHRLTALILSLHHHCIITASSSLFHYVTVPPGFWFRAYSPFLCIWSLCLFELPLFLFSSFYALLSDVFLLPRTVLFEWTVDMRQIRSQHSLSLILPFFHLTVWWLEFLSFVTKWVHIRLMWTIIGYRTVLLRRSLPLRTDKWSPFEYWWRRRLMWIRPSRCWSPLFCFNWQKNEFVCVCVFVRDWTVKRCIVICGKE
jgi:hypothetical protein